MAGFTKMQTELTWNAENPATSKVMHSAPARTDPQNAAMVEVTTAASHALVSDVVRIAEC